MTSLSEVSVAGAAWGDYDGDGLLDIASSGHVYRNDGAAANSRPTAPTNLGSALTGSEVTLTWAASGDAQTPGPGLTYNLRVGTSPGGGDVVSPMAKGTGQRLVAALGNAQHGTSATLRALSQGTYYWSVQALDTAFAGSGFAAEASFTVSASLPTIRSLAPTSGAVGAQVKIVGTNFAGATLVSFGGASATSFAVDSASEITAVVPSGAVTGVIRVTTPTGTATSPTAFTVVPAPTITSFAPAGGPIGTLVSITGTNFNDVWAVAFGGIGGTFTVHSTTSLSATVPAGAQTGRIRITTGMGSGLSASDFTVVIPPPPTVTGFAPTGGLRGSTVAIVGLHFAGATGVTFGGAAAAFAVNSATSISATVPAGATTGGIAVTTPDGTGATARPFTVLPAPTITGMIPASGPPGTPVRITGAGFVGATRVKFNGVTAVGVSAAFVVESDSSIATSVPLGATTGWVTVTTAVGTGASVGEFVVTPVLQPTITSVTPMSGPVGTPVTITGTNLYGTSVVWFNMRPASFLVDSATSISTTVPLVQTPAEIMVAAPGGWVTAPGLFTVTSTTPLPGYFTLAPCRVLDTRAYGGLGLQPGLPLNVKLSEYCGIPETARAVSLNVTVTEATAMGNLRLYPADVLAPTVSTINYSAGQTRANNAIIQIDARGYLAVTCTQATGKAHMILDVNGYFQEP